MSTSIPVVYLGKPLPQPIVSLLQALGRDGFECDSTSSGRTITVSRGGVPYGYIKPYVLQLKGVLGYHLAPLGLGGQQCPIEDFSDLVRRFCQRYACDPSDVTDCRLTGTNKGRALLIIKNPHVALRALLQEAGVKPYERMQITRSDEQRVKAEADITDRALAAVAPREAADVEDQHENAPTSAILRGGASGDAVCRSAPEYMKRAMTQQNDKQARLGELFQCVWECRLCPRVVPSLVARIPSGCESRLALMAQAPGRHGVRETGLQWRGRDGKLRRPGIFLDNYLRRVGYSVDPESQRYPRPYTTNVVHCWPGSAGGGDPDRAPSSDEISSCRRWWQEELRIVRPRVLVLLGRLATETFAEACGLSLSFSAFLNKCGLTCNLNGLILQCFALPHPTARYRGRGELYEEAFSVIGRVLKDPD